MARGKPIAEDFAWERQSSYTTENKGVYSHNEEFYEIVKQGKLGALGLFPAHRCVIWITILCDFNNASTVPNKGLSWFPS